MLDSSNPLPHSENPRWLALACFLTVTFFVAGVSTVFTTPAIPMWYAALAKPSFNPPNQIFGPVWTLLYCLMAVAAWLVWKRPSSELRSRALLLFWVQLALNFAWSLIFFGQHRIGFGLIDIVLLWVAIALTSVKFFSLSRAAGWMFVPYLAWVSFASILNLEIWRLN
jgi:benzodiazapine receptor